MGRERTLVQRDLISAQIAEQTSLINPRSFADRPFPSRPPLSVLVATEFHSRANTFFLLPSYRSTIFHYSLTISSLASFVGSKPIPILLLAIFARMGAAAERRHRHARWNFEGRNSSRNSRDGSPPPPPTPTKYSIYPPRRGLWVIDIYRGHHPSALDPE